MTILDKKKTKFSQKHTISEQINWVREKQRKEKLIFQNLKAEQTTLFWNFKNDQKQNKVNQSCKPVCGAREHLWRERAHSMTPSDYRKRSYRMTSISVFREPWGV